jgi:DNA-binding transcriptional ArsR family regulator
MCFLGKKQKNVSEIMECSELSQPQISRYLWMMKIEWILESQKIGKEVFYEIKDKKILEIIKALKNIYL